VTGECHGEKRHCATEPSVHTGGVKEDPYAFVPVVDENAEADPHWLELRNDATLPPIYMPPAMAGRHSPRQRFVATGLIGILVLGTALGVCLTYGPKVLGW